MYILIPILVIVIVISFVLGRKAQNRIVSELTPFSFADDNFNFFFYIKINRSVTGAIF